MCLREDIAKEARKDGSAAFRDGTAIQWNPHQIGTMECRKWYEGWYASERSALEEKLFPKEIRESNEYLSFKQELFPNSDVLTTNEFLFHWWWDKMERKRLFEVWTGKEKKPCQR